MSFRESTGESGGIKIGRRSVLNHSFAKRSPPWRRKLACLFYRLLTSGQQYVDKGMEYYEARHREQQIRYVTKAAQRLGLQVTQPNGQTAWRVQAAPERGRGFVLVLANGHRIESGWQFGDAEAGGLFYGNAALVPLMYAGT